MPSLFKYFKSDFLEGSKKNSMTSLKIILIQIFIKYRSFRSF